VSFKKEKRPEIRTRIITVLLVLAILIGSSVVALRFDLLSLIISPGRQLFQETTGDLQKVIFPPLATLRRNISSHLNIDAILEENRLLKTEVEQLQQEITTYREAIVENQHLKQLLNMKRQVSCPVKVANVIGVDLTPWRAVIKIDLGRNQGIRRDMPVLSGAGVLGRVIEVNPSSSTVMMLTDFDSRIAAIIQRNRARGILKGRGKEPCLMEYVEKGIGVEPGDKVITSGLDGIFPKGLLLGEVDRVENGPPADLFQTIEVRPYTDTDTVEWVMVMLTKE